MAKLFTPRIWILIISLLLAFLAINPSPGAKGVEITTVTPGSAAAFAGIQEGETILTFNDHTITTLTDYNTALATLDITPQIITVETDQGTFTYNVTTSFGFSLGENNTLLDVRDDTPLQRGMTLKSINNNPIINNKNFETLQQEILPSRKIIITTNAQEYAFLLSEDLGLSVQPARKSNIQQGLDLQGGTRVLLKPVSQEPFTEQDLQNLISVLSNRLNVYGLSDLTIRPARDLDDNSFILVEIAGATREEVRTLIAQQGKFEAKIGDDLVFEGGKKDITYVCKDDGSCAGIQPPCTQASEGVNACTFQFVITLSQEAAERHATITAPLTVNTTPSGNYLSKTIDFYLDNKLVDSLRISADLQGQKNTQIAISGPGYGPTEEAAYEAALTEMHKLQTVLITGSLPVDLEIEKIDTISPTLGQEFLKNSLITGLIAIISVALVVSFRYKKPAIIIPMIITMISELLLTLGVAAFIKWNIDVASIAGIIAAIGTGVDDQIVITDEVLRGEKYLNWKNKLKNAFFIVFAAYAVTLAAMLPLWNAGAGLIRGFAVTTIIGVTVGVLITRPAYGVMIEKPLNK